MASPKFFNPFDEILKHGEKLPHWQQPGGTYFATFRLVYSLPQERIKEWREERALWSSRYTEPWDENTEADYHATFSVRIDQWMDEGAGDCLLGAPEVREELEQAVFRFHGVRYFLHSFVIMPNHVHFMVTLGDEMTLEKLMQAWKGTSARGINQLRGSSGAVWQKNYFDRLIRDEDHFFRVARYIRQNPAKGRVAEGHYSLWESKEVKSMLGE